MATPTQALLDHLGDNWSYTGISYENFNVPFDPNKTRSGFTNNDIYIAPLIELNTATAREIPLESGTVEERYIFSVSVIADSGVGTQTITARVANLKSLYDRKKFTHESVQFYFDAIIENRGFSVQDGARFEVLVALPFHVFI